jgi:hypothetical protein
MGLLLLLVLVGLVVFFVWRSAELFCLSWRGDRLVLVRGRLPPMLKGDLADALSHMKAPPCTVVARKEEGGAQLRAHGLDEFAEQRLRNIFRLYPISALRAARAPSRGRLWRLLGISWLVVWALGDRDE